MEILEKVKSRLPSEVVSRIELEGSEIVVYTKDKEFFLTCEDQIRKIVSELKKRIEVRPEKNICLDEAYVKQKIMEIVPEEARIKNIYFEPERSLVIISAEKPGLVIGKGGETFRKIKQETLWVPRIERVPSLKSDIIEGIRKVLHKNVKFRKRFLNEIGKKIFSERKTNRNWIRIIPLGGYREVGRSCTLVETPKSKVLVDCGVNVGGLNGNLLPYFQTKEFDYTELDAIIVSHAHLDHCGAVPMLYEHGYDGPLYMTTPTIDLAVLLWLDFIDVMQRNGINPIFTARGVKEAVKHCITLEYNEVSDVAPDVRLTFANAGHILGSALIHLHIGEGMHNILYACDQKFGRTTLLDPAQTKFQRIETLITEATYGGVDDIMPPRHEAEKQLMDIINKTMERGGIALIPSFSVERAQDVMVILAENNFQYPVFIDGMIWDANGIFSAYPEYLSRRIQRKIFAGEDPFVNPIFKRVASQADREKVMNEKPCVIISTSGMLIGGPALTYLQNLAEDPKNTLIFVGYQAEGTMGRRIQKGWKEIPFRNEEGKTYTVKLEMEVQTVNGLSGHSDRNQLLAFVGKLSDRPEKVIVCHGENSKVLQLARSIHKLFRIETVATRNLESIRLR
ncbi:MAG: beta-CASP ribonuclease aCPSF1 [Candidatus Aenigmatarchaeota archaeon]|nr:MAG: beta-CASP ribonuclease aCPSF1 [Candidatus Aenigmarchaeota archaeon]